MWFSCNDKAAHIAYSLYHMRTPRHNCTHGRGCISKFMSYINFINTFCFIRLPCRPISSELGARNLAINANFISIIGRNHFWVSSRVYRDKNLFKNDEKKRLNKVQSINRSFLPLIASSHSRRTRTVLQFYCKYFLKILLYVFLSVSPFIRTIVTIDLYWIKMQVERNTKT